jgi:hypothetical protein
MNFVGCIPRFLKKNAGWVLTALGTAGFIGTSYLIAKEAPVAKDKVAMANQDHVFHWAVEHDEEIWAVAGFPDEAYLTTMEKLKVALPIYIPAIATGLATMGCFWGAQIFNAKKQAALVAMYGALVTQFDQYREAIKAEHGEEADQRALEFSRKKIRDLQEEILKLKEENGPFLYEFACLPGVIFEKKAGQIDNLTMHYNRNVLLGEGGNLADLFRLAGLDKSLYDEKEAAKYGWRPYENEIEWGQIFIDFYFIPVKTRDGRTVRIIDTYVPPYELDIDYGFEGDTSAHLYPHRNVELAREIAESIDGDKYVLQDLTNWCCYAPAPY